MNKVFSKSLFSGIIALLGLSAAAQAAPTINLLTDQGSWRVTTYSPTNAVTGTASSTLTNPYGVPPGPTITPITNNGNTIGWALTFAPTADFMAFASNSGGSVGKTVTMDGKLNFTFTLDAQTGPQKLTANVYEDGIYALTGNGTADVTAGVVIQGMNGAVVAEQHSASNPAETRNGAGGWTSFVQAGSFASAFTTYNISIDNTLLAESISAQTAGSGYIAKKDFTIILTTDGSNGGGAGSPEPASLGIMALGGIALLARRRRA